MNKQIIKLNPDLLHLVKTGIKTSTCRLGVKYKYCLGYVVFQNCEDESELLDINAFINGINLKMYCTLTDEIAEMEGYSSADELRSVLKDIYGEIKDHDFITVIEWQ